jgi:hypothetical protein
VLGTGDPQHSERISFYEEELLGKKKSFLEQKISWGM